MRRSVIRRGRYREVLLRTPLGATLPAVPPRPVGRWSEARRLVLALVGTLVTAIGYALFQVPHAIAAGGVTGLAIILERFTGWSVGTTIFVMNLPMLALGFRYLEGWRFLVYTTLSVGVFSIAADAMTAWMPGLVEAWPVTDNVLLSALYAGILGGVGLGLLYRAGGTLGGTGVLGRILQMRTGTPLSQLYLYTDGAIVVVAGLVLGWEVALYAMLALFLNGLASDYVLEGPSSVRTATIITEHPRRVAGVLMAGLGRGVSYWGVVGAYTGRRRCMLLCTLFRPQVDELKRLVFEADHGAFLTIGVSHQAHGGGFPRPSAF